MTKLVLPNLKYLPGQIKALKEYARDGRYELPDLNKIIKLPPKKYISTLRKQARGIGLPKGYVPQTSYWLIDKDRYVGEIRLKHRLNKQLKKIGGHVGYIIKPKERKRGYGTKILKLAFPKLKKIGIKRALITCDKTNIGSRKIIENNGGKFYREIKIRGRKVPTLQYWVKIN